MELKLEPISEKHAPSLAQHGNSEKVFSGLRGVFVPPYRLEDAQEFIRAALQDFRTRTFAIVYEGVPIGVTTLSFKEDVYRFNGEIGYWIGESFWNRGIATESIRLLLKIAFSEHGLHRIYAEVFSNRPASARALEKNGFVLEGTHKEAIFKNGSFLDQWIYSKLRNSTPSTSLVEL
ncbi:N-acetyltransferase [Leptospira gomenensis]|uniref:N-acetyltransferase n=1 Tax=Leptospira gomenensis TaxID=2484974 RepID=A0A5F1Z163_9LEPT|nr:GNAT family protein [Leptospira gomenensis]TGK31012.1 N-acetyltransferase [Leptospira gomenensis]TGK43218.1 N-acetyltransferase [Leptospira gomenensis]TGK45268.1 N-acetyltransferase [Leptospira gomenensis]TGK66182.1 N-acetyltransferase [Leptospira gomenensis]